MNLRYSLLYIFLLSYTFCLGKTIYIKHDATNGQANGTSWSDAYLDLTKAITNAEIGDNLWVAEGIYKPESATWPITSSFFIHKRINLYGGFAGVETHLYERNPTINETILTTGTNVLHYQNANGVCVLDGFIISEGYAEIPPQFNIPCDTIDSDLRRCIGGGIFIYSDTTLHPTSLHIKNCRFQNNRANAGGAIGIRALSGNVGILIDSCIFENNSSSVIGGAIHALYENGIYNDSFEIKNSQFIENGGQYYSGVIDFESYKAQHPFLIDNCNFNENISAIYGPSVLGYFNSSQGKIINSTFENNSKVVDFNAVQGVIWGHNLKIENCKFHRNSSNVGGAIQGTRLKVFNSVFSKNTSTKEGGVCRIMHNGKTYPDTSEFVNCTFLDNQSEREGGIVTASNSYIKFSNCVMANNQAVETGDFIYSHGFTKVALQNTISDIAFGDIIIGDNLSTDSIQINIGNIFNQTLHFQDPTNNNYRLSGCSIGRNFGDSTLLPPDFPLTDIEGNPRIQDGQIDIGAFEQGAFEVFTEVEPASCDSAANGTVRYLAENGSGVLSGFWTHDGEMTTELRNDLLAGNYSIIISDEAGCVDSTDVDILVASEPFSIISSIRNASGAAVNNGSIMLSFLPNVDSMPYLILWSNGDTGAGLENALPGIYTAMITDTFGCSVFFEGEILGTSNLFQVGNEIDCKLIPNIDSPYQTVSIQKNGMPVECDWMKIYTSSGKEISFYQHVESFQSPAFSGVYWVEVMVKGKQNLLKLIIK